MDRVWVDDTLEEIDAHIQALVWRDELWDISNEEQYETLIRSVIGIAHALYDLYDEVFKMKEKLK